MESLSVVGYDIYATVLLFIVVCRVKKYFCTGSRLSWTLTKGVNITKNPEWLQNSPVDEATLPNLCPFTALLDEGWTSYLAESPFVFFASLY